MRPLSERMALRDEFNRQAAVPLSDQLTGEDLAMERLLAEIATPDDLLEALQAADEIHQARLEEYDLVEKNGHCYLREEA